MTYNTIWNQGFMNEKDVYYSILCNFRLNTRKFYIHAIIFVWWLLTLTGAINYELVLLVFKPWSI